MIGLEVSDQDPKYGGVSKRDEPARLRRRARITMLQQDEVLVIRGDRVLPYAET